jgi:hypothetical protein
MRRVFLLLGVGGAVLLAGANPAAAQDEAPTLGCIPTSETPFYVGLEGPLPPTEILLLIDSSAVVPWIVGSAGVTPEGFASFGPGIAPGTYVVALANRFGVFQVLGTVQIGNCSPTTKQECLDGGWRGFDFKNQGQCIAFVNRGERP